MQVRQLSTFLVLLISLGLGAQSSNEYFTNPTTLDILNGNYDPVDYQASTVIVSPDDIFQGLVDEINPDTLKSYLEILSTFENRNTGSDTLSDVRGIGASQRWVLSKFEEYSQRRENRLVSSFFVFDQVICGMGRHKDVLTVLPGQGPQKDEVIIVLAHLDSRCETGCDIDCEAHGMEDNGSGSALVMELARVMSQYTFNRTIAFMLTTGEEQGLHGARAFANYCGDNGIKIYAAYNNDVIGGVICGQTASPPGCPGLNHIDSINVRVYSQGGTRSKNKMLARFLEIQYNEHLAPRMTTPHVINIMSPEDRTGRGGDHIPFRENGFATVRFCSANEHGDGNPSQPDYHDRQHTMDDVLGMDTDGDNVIDSFFVDFNYLSRNAMINGASMASAAFGPQPVADFEVSEWNGQIIVSIDDPLDYGQYRIGVRKLSKNTYDTTYVTDQLVDTFPVSEAFWYYINVATIDEDGIQSLFCLEKDVRILSTDTKDLSVQKSIELLQNFPNPFDEATTIAVIVNESIQHDRAEIRMMDQEGKVFATLPITLKIGSNEVQYSYQNHGFQPGIYHYGLWVDDVHVATKSMIYAY